MVAAQLIDQTPPAGKTTGQEVDIAQAKLEALKIVNAASAAAAGAEKGGAEKKMNGVLSNGANAMDEVDPPMKKGGLNGAPNGVAPGAHNGNDRVSPVVEGSPKEESPDPASNPNLPPASIARKIPCRFFPMGNCKYGTQCIFSHDLANGPVPPPPFVAPDQGSMGMFYPPGPPHGMGSPEQHQAMSSPPPLEYGGYMGPGGFTHFYPYPPPPHMPPMHQNYHEGPNGVVHPPHHQQGGYQPYPPMYPTDPNVNVNGVPPPPPPVHSSVPGQQQGHAGPPPPPSQPHMPSPPPQHINSSPSSPGGAGNPLPPMTGMMAPPPPPPTQPPYVSYVPHTFPHDFAIQASESAAAAALLQTSDSPSRLPPNEYAPSSPSASRNHERTRSLHTFFQTNPSVSSAPQTAPMQAGPNGFVPRQPGGNNPRSNGSNGNGARRSSSHQPLAPVPGLPLNGSGGPGGKPYSGRSRYASHDPSSSKAARGAIPCTFFAESRCRYGDGCHYIHQLPDGTDARRLGKGWCGSDGTTEREVARRFSESKKNKGGERNAGRFEEGHVFAGINGSIPEGPAYYPHQQGMVNGFGNHPGGHHHHHNPHHPPSDVMRPRPQPSPSNDKRSTPPVAPSVAAALGGLGKRQGQGSSPLSPSNTGGLPNGEADFPALPQLPPPVLSSTPSSNSTATTATTAAAVVANGVRPAATGTNVTTPAASSPSSPPQALAQPEFRSAAAPAGEPESATESKVDNTTAASAPTSSATTPSTTSLPVSQEAQSSTKSVGSNESSTTATPSASAPTSSPNPAAAAPAKLSFSFATAAARGAAAPNPVPVKAKTANGNGVNGKANGAKNGAVNGKTASSAASGGAGEGKEEKEKVAK